MPLLPNPFMKTHHFKDEDIHDVIKNVTASPLENEDARTTLRRVAIGLKDLYPDHVHLDEKYDGLRAGGIFWNIWCLCTSFNEYLIFFGSNIGTEGHAGRFAAMNYHEFGVTGALLAQQVGKFEHEVIRPGDQTVYKTGEAYHWNMAPGTWVLEHGRGFVPRTFMLGISDSLFSQADTKMAWNCATGYLKALRQATKPAGDEEWPQWAKDLRAEELRRSKLATVDLDYSRG